MAPRVRIRPQAAGSDDEFIDIDHVPSSDLNSDSNHYDDNAPIARPDPSQNRNSNQSRSTTGGAVGHRSHDRTDNLEQVWKLIMLNWSLHAC
jgi:hypothetical protein